MTITTSTNVSTFLGNGTQTVFDFSFIAGNASYISVIHVTAAGISTVLASSAYTLAINAAVPGAIWGIGGVVTYPLIGSPIPTGDTLTVLRTVPDLQTVSLSNQGSQTPQSMEQGLDLIEMQLQQTATTSNYAFTAPTTDASPPLPAPPAAQRANQAAVFDANGNLTAGVAPASGVISSTMQPVVSASTLANGRTNLGLKALATEGYGAGLSDDGSGNARVNQTVVQDATAQSVTSTYAWNLRVATVAVIYTLPAGSTLWNGFTFTVDAQGGQVTLAIAGTDTFAGQSSGASFIVPVGYAAVVTTDGASNATWYARLTLLSPSVVGGASVPGDVKMTATNTVPAGWLQNNGQAVSRTTFANLFAAIGTTYGSGDGSTTFNVPNDQGYFWRSWNGGATGLDPSRTFGSTQAFAMQTHSHSTTIGGTGLAAAAAQEVVLSSNVATSTGNNTGNSAAETRPSNIAYLSVIKY